MDRDRAVTRSLLDRHGRTYAEEAGISLADRPAPLYQLLVLTTLFSAPIRGEVAVTAARELFAAGYGTPQRMAAATWRQRVDALGRGHYRRYDERTATMLGEGARLCLDRWQGDLRRLHREARGDVARLRRLLDEFPGIGRTGADIFLREVQMVWSDVRPFVDRRVADGAGRLRLPRTPDKLAGLVGPAEFPRLASALVRASRDGKVVADVSGATPEPG